MQRNLNLLDRRSRWRRWGMLAFVAVLLSACGPLGDDTADPTATSENVTQPIGGAGQEADSTPDTPPSVPDTNGATPGPPMSTPVVTVPNNPPGMQATPGDDGPAAVTAPGEGPSATPVTTSDTGSFAGSDGTSGATPVTDAPVGVPLLPGVAEGAGTPAATPVQPTDSAATAEVVSLAEAEPVTVTSCAPETVPPLAGSQTDYLTVSDVNFRTGPGADCDVIGAGPIGINIPVTVLSGPVVREGDEEFTWVQVQIADETGWIIVEVLEPAS